MKAIEKEFCIKLLELLELYNVTIQIASDGGVAFVSPPLISMDGTVIKDEINVQFPNREV